MLIGKVRSMLPCNHAAFRIWQSRGEDLPTFAFGHSQVYYVATRFVDQLRIENTDSVKQEKTWHKIKDFLQHHEERTVVGYIGYEAVNQDGMNRYDTSFPLVHLVVPLDVDRFDTNTIHEDFMSSKIDLSQYDVDKGVKSGYSEAVDKVLDWIGDDEERKVTIARKVMLPPLDLWKSFLQDPNKTYRHFSFYYGIDELEFVGHSPEMTMFRSPGSEVLLCEKASGTFPKGKKTEFAKDKKNLYEHKLSIDSLIEKLRKVAHIADVSRDICDFPNLQHFVTSFKLRPKENSVDVMKALFPTGAKPLEGIKLVRELETFSRGPYYGLFFAKLNNGEIQVYHILRSLFREGQDHYAICGAGITCNSDAGTELRETELKLSSINARA